MPDPFPHLHVASGYSLQYGASHPHVLVERAAEQEMDTLALTDRDGTYGAVKFAKACLQAGIRPVLGVDLAYRDPPVDPSGPRRPRTPARGGAFRDLPAERGGLPRATFLAAADTHGGRAGWAALCRLVSAVQLAGERGSPVLDLGDLPAGVADLLGSGDLVVLLGPASSLGVAATRRRDDLAPAALAPWRALVPRSHLVVELVSHRLPGGGPGGASGRHDGWGPGTTPHAARMAGAAGQAGLSAVLTNAVRHADRRDAVTADVLDAARRLVALDRRHLDRANAEGFLKSGKQMHEIAEEVVRAAGLGERDAVRLLADTRKLADRCALDPRADLGLGEVHFPEFIPSLHRARQRRRRAARPLRGGGRRPVRLGAAAGDLEAARRRARAGPGPGLRLLLPHRRRHHRPGPRDGGALRRPRLGRGQPGHLPARHLRGRPDPPRPADGAVPLPAARRPARHRRRRRVGPAPGGLRGDPRPLRRRAVRVRLDDGHLPRAARRARRRRGARHASRRDRRDRQGVPAHPGPRRPGRAARAARAAGRRAGRARPRPDVPARRAARRAAAPHRRAPLRGAALRRHPARPDPGGGQLRRLPDEPVRQGRRRGPRPAQARRPRHPDAVRDGPRGRGDQAGRRGRGRPRRRGAGAVRRPRDLRDDQQRPHARGLPDRVAGAARAGRQVRHRDLLAGDHRHLAVPSGAGQERHDHPLPRGQAGLARGDLPAPRPAPDPRGDLRRRGLPRAGDRDHRPLRADRLRRGRRAAPGARRRRGDGRDQGLVLPAGAGPRLPAPGGGAGVGGAGGLRLVRLLQGPRGGVRAPDLPVGLAQDPLDGPLPRRRAHPRPRHVPQAADPRGRPPARRHDPRPRRQPQREELCRENY